MLSGEPGIGKTALIGETLRRSRERGWEPLAGRATEFERDLPFALFADVLDNHLGRLGNGRLGSIEEEELALLAGAFPALAAITDVRSPASWIDERHRLLRAIQALLELLAGEQPLVLALDDLHWADPASIDLVCRMLHRGMGCPSLLLLASRPAPSEPRLRATYADAQRHGRARLIELAPLSAADAHRLLGADLEPGVAGLLYRESGGNPLYLEQLAAAVRRGSGLKSGAAGVELAGVPMAVSAALARELEALAPAARTLLRGAAVLGDPFEPELAAETAGIEDGGALAALDELLAIGLIRLADSPRRFRFRHPIVRAAVYEDAGPGWRLAAHARAAAALLARGAPASAAAHHVERSAQPNDEQALALLERAGDETAVRAPAASAHWFEAALRLVPDGEGNLDRCLSLLARRAAALGIVGRIEDSRRTLHEFLNRSPERQDDLRVHLAVLAAIFDTQLGSQDVGRRVLLAELGRLADRRGWAAAELQRELAFTCCLDADWEGMAGWARRSLACRCEGMVRVGALAALGLAEIGLGRFQDGAALVREGGDLFDSLSDHEVAAIHPGIAMWLGWAEVCSERFELAIEHLERCIRISRQVGQRHLTAALLAVQGQALALTGRGEQLAGVAEAATEAALMSESDLFLSWAMTLRSQASIQAGDVHAAIRFGERAAGAAARVNSPLSGIARMVLASALLAGGEPERSRALLLDADGEPDLPPFPLYEGHCYELLVGAELALGHLQRAEALAQRAERAVSRLGMQLPHIHVCHARAMVAIQQGQPAEARAVAMSLCQMGERIGVPVEVGRGQILAGKAFAAAGQRAAAIAALESAHQRLTACGAFLYGEEAARELRRLGRAAPSRARRLPDRADGLSLTEREHEVMELVASGKTNREIAEHLILSVRTVDRHVSRIFDKLKVSSRAAAASTFERARSGSLTAARPLA